MTHLDINQLYKLYTDSCYYAFGAILVQEDQEGVEIFVQYLSHALRATGRECAERMRVEETERRRETREVTKLLSGTWSGYWKRRTATEAMHLNKGFC